MAQCQYQGCNNQEHNLGKGYCALHCEKSLDYSKDWSSGLLFGFYDELIQYILTRLIHEI